jgi:hypothetical protein
MALLLAALLAAAPADRYVDPAATAGGDGSRAHPLRTIAEALGPGVRVHLASGQYPGPIALPDGAALIGTGHSTIDTNGGSIRVEGEGTLERVIVEGGAAGLDGERARVTLRNVRFTGQRDAAIKLEGGTLQLSDTELAGPARGLDLHATRLVATGLVARTSDGSRLRQSEAQISRATFGADPGVALSIAGGHTRLERVTLEGGTDGMLANDHAQLTLVDVTASGAQTGFGLVQASATLQRVSATSKTGDGARWLNSQVRGSFEVGSARGCGLMINDGEVVLDALTVTSVHSTAADEGCALNARRAKVSLRKLEASKLSGTAIWAAQLATVRFERAHVREVGQSALIVETGAQVTGGLLDAERTHEAAVVVSGPAQLTLERLRTEVEPPLETTCDTQTQVHIARGLPKPADAYCHAPME